MTSRPQTFSPFWRRRLASFSPPGPWRGRTRPFLTPTELRLPSWVPEATCLSERWLPLCQSGRKPEVTSREGRVCFHPSPSPCPLWGEWGPRAGGEASAPRVSIGSTPSHTLPFCSAQPPAPGPANGGREECPHSHLPTLPGCVLGSPHFPLDPSGMLGLRLWVCMLSSSESRRASGPSDLR